MCIRFKDLNVAMNTAALWGRRIHHVAVSDSVIFALSDSGEVIVNNMLKDSVEVY